MRERTEAVKVQKDGDGKYPFLRVRATSREHAAFLAAKWCHEATDHQDDDGNWWTTGEPRYRNALLDEVQNTDDPSVFMVVVEAW